MALPYHSFISWEIEPLTIQSFGVMMAIGFLAILYIVTLEAKRKGLSKDHLYNLAFWSLVGALVGSRIPYVLFNWDQFSGDLLGIFKIWEGGLMFFGGFILALIFSIIYVRSKKLNFWRYADAAALSLPLGHAFGRIGCILGDGGHVGKITTMPWGVLVNGELRHLTALYSVIYLFLIFGILFLIRKRKVFDGFIAAMYLVFYGVARFLMEFTREEMLYFGLDLPQWICILMVVLGLGFIYYKKKNEIF